MLSSGRAERWVGEAWRDLLAFLVLKIVERESAVGLEWAIEVPHLIVHLVVPQCVGAQQACATHVSDMCRTCAKHVLGHVLDMVLDWAC